MHEFSMKALYNLELLGSKPSLGEIGECREGVRRLAVEGNDSVREEMSFLSVLCACV